MASSKSRRNNRKNAEKGTISKYLSAAFSKPALMFVNDIVHENVTKYIPIDQTITNDNFTPEAIKLLRTIAEDRNLSPGETIRFTDEDYDNYGSRFNYNVRRGSTAPDLFEELANLSPADEVKYVLGQANVSMDERGNIRVNDQYDYNFYGDFENDKVLTPEEFENSDISLLDALKKSWKNKKGIMSFAENVGFLLGARDYADDTRDTGRSVLLDLGNINEPLEVRPTSKSRKKPVIAETIKEQFSSVRPKARPEGLASKTTQTKQIPEETKEIARFFKTLETKGEDKKLFGEVSEYLDELPERELAPETSVRPQARPKDETAELFGEVSEYLDKLPERELSPKTSVRPQARPTRTVETPAAEPASVDTDSMSFGDAFKYYADNTDQDVFEWRGNKYKAERKFAEGGVVEKQMNRLYQEGGLADDGARVEPVTGNEVPPGSMDQEVRDNVDAKLSEGEYVVPADVVRYYGIRFFEDLRAKAKEDLSKMESEGRIGGEPVDAQGVPMEDDELTPEEMQMLAEALGQAPRGMAMGGMVQQQQPIPAYNPYAQQQMQYNNPNTPMPVGMAKGGEVKAPEFNPSQYQLYPSGNQMGAGSGGGIEIVDYINVETGQIRPVTLMNGQPMGLVPEGFVRATPENRKQAMENAGMASEQMGEKTTEEVLDVRDDSESEQRRMEQAGQTGASGGFNNWAEENYDKIQKDPMGYIEEKLGAEDTLIDRAMSAGAKALIGGGGLIGGLIGVGLQASKELTPLSEARAALSVMEDRGMDTTKAKSMIETYESALPRGLNLADDVLAPGTRRYESLVKYGSTLASPSATSTSTTTRTPTSTYRDSGDSASEERARERARQLSGGEDVTVSTDSSGVTRATSGGASVTVGSAAPRTGSSQVPSGATRSSSTVSKARDARSNPGGFDEEEETWSAGPMAEGGFVARPSNYKSKVTRKKEKRRRGLGSK